MSVQSCESCHALQRDEEMFVYKFDGGARLHHVCSACHYSEHRHAYDHDSQVAIQHQLNALQTQETDSLDHARVLREQLARVTDSIRELQIQSKNITTEIASSVQAQRHSSEQITDLKELIQTGRMQMEQVESQKERLAMKHVPGSVYRKMPRADDRSLAWMMLTHPRLGTGDNCAAQNLNKNENVLDMIRDLCLTESTLSAWKRNCDILLAGLNSLPFQHNQDDLVEKIKDANLKDTAMYGRGGGPQFSIEQRVDSHLEVICVVNRQEKDTMRHVLLSSEFLGRNLITGVEHEHIGIGRKSRDQVYTPPPTLRGIIAKYVSQSTRLVQKFSRSLAMLSMPSGYRRLVRVSARAFSGKDDMHGDNIEVCITHEYTSVAPMVRLELPEDQDVSVVVSLYNLNGEDLALSGEPIEQSAQIQGGKFRARKNENGVLLKHDSNVVPAHGVGCLQGAYCGNVFTLRDVVHNVLLEFMWDQMP